MDTTIADELIVGRVEPHIYAFKTQTVPNYLKVGDTYRPIEQRLDEWRKYFPKLERMFSDAAKVNDKTFFRDFAVHFFLENEKHLRRLQPDTIKNLPYYSKEFFENATVENIKEAISDIAKSFSENSNKYQFYSLKESRVPMTYTYNRTESYEPRPNQQETINRYISAVNAGRTNLLMYAVMRFGKSFTSMCCAAVTGAKLVIIVSAKADVKEEWKRTVESHKKFSDYVFFDSKSLQENPKALSIELNKNKVVVFLTLQDLCGDKIKSRHKEIFKNEFDLLIIDESHYGARAEEYGKVLKVQKFSKAELKQELADVDSSDDYENNETLKTLKAKVRLHLSGTPYRILMSDEFTKDDIVAFYQFTDIVKDQEKWNEENLLKDDVKEWDNPYFGFPQMLRFAFNPNESSVKKMEELKKSGITYAFSELFRPQSITKDTEHNQHKEFCHKKEVLDLLKVIDGSKTDNNILSFLDFDKIKDGKMCRHIVIVLPYRASCDALEKLITDNTKSFKNLGSYKILNITGVEKEEIFKDTASVRQKISDCEKHGSKTITLTVNRMLTGSTVPEWDTMIYLKDTTSPQEYDQAIFRLQNQYVKTLTDSKGDTIKYNMKPQTLLVDFNPNRMFQLQEQKSQIYNVNVDKNGNSKLEERINEELRISPIICVNKNKLQQVEPENILDAVRAYSQEKSVMDEATDIPADYALLSDEELKTAIERLSPIDAKKGIDIKAATGEGDDLDISDSPSDTSENEDTDNATATSENQSQNEDAEDAHEALEKKLATYYAEILFFAFLTESKVKSLEEIIGAIDENNDNKRIARNVGLQKNILQIIQTKCNPFILSKLDYKIQNINTLMNDKKLKPDERVEVAMNKFGRLSSSEIVTPMPVAKEMTDLLPENDITTKSKILDIASKQGEFTRALYAKFGSKIKKNIYAIPTSTVAYEFTRKVYNLLGMPVENVYSDFTSYDLIDETKNDKIIKELKEMNYDMIVGNPPYQETKAKKETQNGQKVVRNIFHYFQILSDALGRYTLLIYPGERWIHRSGKGLEDFGKKQINDSHLQKIIYYPNSSEVFPQADITDGISIVLKDFKKKDFGFQYEYKRKESSHEVQISDKPENNLLPLNPADVLIINQIKKIVKYNNFKYLSESIFPRTLFGIESDFVEKNPNKVHVYNGGDQFDLLKEVKLFTNNKAGAAGRTCWYITKKENISSGMEYINKWKVVVSSAHPGGQMNRDNQIAVLDNYSVFGRSRVALKIFDTEAEAQNFLKYAKSNFIRFAFLMTDESLTSLAKWVPDINNYKSDNGLIDFSKNINDEIYRLFEISDKERLYIDKVIAKKDE